MPSLGRIVAQGLAARRDGQPETANPYRYGTAHWFAWRLGWENRTNRRASRAINRLGKKYDASTPRT